MSVQFPSSADEPQFSTTQLPTYSSLFLFSLYLSISSSLSSFFYLLPSSSTCQITFVFHILQETPQNNTFCISLASFSSLFFTPFSPIFFRLPFDAPRRKPTADFHLEPRNLCYPVYVVSHVDVDARDPRLAAPDSPGDDAG